MSPENPTGPKLAPASAASSSSASGPVLGTDPAYPPYAVEFSGGSMPAPILVTGPHRFAMEQGGLQMTVELVRNPSDGTRPNLGIKFTQG